MNKKKKTVGIIVWFAAVIVLLVLSLVTGSGGKSA